MSSLRKWREKLRNIDGLASLAHFKMWEFSPDFLTLWCALAQNVGIPTVISIREFSLYRGDSRGIAGNLNVTSFWQRRLRRKWIDMRRSWPRLARRPSKGPIAHTEMKCSFPRQKPNKALIFLYNLQRVNWEQKSWCVFPCPSKIPSSFFGQKQTLQTLSKHFGKQVFHTVYTLVATENESRQTKKDEFLSKMECKLMQDSIKSKTYSIYFRVKKKEPFLEGCEMLGLAF